MKGLNMTPESILQFCFGFVAGACVASAVYIPLVWGLKKTADRLRSEGSFYQTAIRDELHQEHDKTYGIPPPPTSSQSQLTKEDFK